ncbi:L,D-transpeptidase family protein [Microvirga sp. STR05]|uniref:L,D-transpeptidase family protein n=1 Tax=Hymenobacter duratus TaxID=2771356 RepID=A0ABR8JLX7_9BACT|nr:L,D-transpeptidase family protein [Hymenobacter duratus]MBD2715539.1 L,D-transpeptidase family protein [Hymenobacter duratus]MBR7950447.1 L,D-transpeptidase family protein [Microvirga sp. STR05]
MSAVHRLLCYVSSLMLAGPWCHSGAHKLPPATTSPALAAAPESQEVPVADLIRQLLDTAAAPGAGLQRSLQAGPDVRALYGAGFQPLWTTSLDSVTADARAALALLARAPEYGLRTTDYHWLRLQALRDSLRRPAPAGSRARQQARLEVFLSDAALRFMHDLSTGRLRPSARPEANPADGAAWEPVRALREALGRGAVPMAMLSGQPRHREYRQLQEALASWLAAPVPPDSAAWHQARYELAAVNLERWRWTARSADSSYILLNIPAYELLVLSADSVVRRHRVVVGQPRTPTPTLSSRITHFTLAPDWHVPHSIATREILPHLKADAGYLALNNYSLYDAQGRFVDARQINWQAITAKNFRYTVRQSAGCDNALGNIVFRFANPYSVYLHDTPVRQIFDRPDRALSHGCMRLQAPLSLAAYLMRREGRTVRLPTEAECARQTVSRTVYLRRPMPLHICYATCTAERGRLRFFADIYHRDEVLRRALFGPRS